MPRPATENELVDFVGRVPRAKYLRLREHFPFYGFNNWFVNTVLEELLDQMDKDPTLVDRVRAAVAIATRRDPGPYLP